MSAQGQALSLRPWPFWPLRFTVQSVTPIFPAAGAAALDKRQRKAFEAARLQGLNARAERAPRTSAAIGLGARGCAIARVAWTRKEVVPMQGEHMQLVLVCQRRCLGVWLPLYHSFSPAATAIWSYSWCMFALQPRPW